MKYQGLYSIGTSNARKTSPQTILGGREITIDLKSQIGLIITLAVVGIVFSFLSPYFMTAENFQIITRQTAMFVVLGCGITMVLICGGVDLSIGPASVICSIVAVTTLRAWGQVGIPFAILVSLFCGIVLGAFNGIIISRLGINPWLTTLATNMLYRGIALVIASGHTIQAASFGLSDFISANLMGIPVLGLIAIVVCIVCHIILTQTAYGRSIKGIGSNAEAAKYCGIPISRNVFLVYVIAGLLAAIMGIMEVGRSGSASPVMNEGIELYVMAAVVIGGTRLEGGKGSILSTILGVLFIQCVLDGLVLIHLSNSFLKLANGILIIFAVVLDGIRRNISR
jgi:ribose transport system permease protein